MLADFLCCSSLFCELASSEKYPDCLVCYEDFPLVRELRLEPLAEAALRAVASLLSEEV